MEIQGKVVAVLPKQSGTSKAGKAWEKQEFILEYQEGGYNRKLNITAMSDKIGLVNTGEEVKAHFIIESREYDGRWYTNATLQGVEKFTQSVPDGQPSDDLPF